MTEGLGVTPVYNLDRNQGNDGMMGGNGMWIFFLFFLLAWGGDGGMFGGKSGSNPAMNQINNDFIYTNLNNAITNQTEAMNSGFAGVNQGLCNLGYTNLSNFKDMQAQMSSCCCETNRNIDAVRYENAKNTCEIVQASDRNADRILAAMNAVEVQGLRDALNTANLQLSQQAQTANLINTIKPCPIPAYITCSPYTTVNPCGLGTC